MQPNAFSRRLKSVDFLRGLAVLAVVGHHSVAYGDYASISAYWFNFVCNILRQGHLGVNLFFVISGFCIHLAWARQQANTGSARVNFIPFWKRRFFRLYPAYLVALCISMFVIAVAVIMKKDIPLVNIYPHPKSIWMALDFLSHVFMLHGLIPVFDNAAGNPPLWSLAREEYLYVMYFILLAWRHARGILGGVFMSFVSGVCFYLAMAMFIPKSSSWWNIIATSSIVLWIQWCLGALAVEAYYGLIKLPRWCYWLWLVPVWAVISKLSENYMPVLSPLLWGMTFFTLLNYCASAEKDGRWKANVFTERFAYAGLISYSLYLIHYPVRGVIKQLLGPFAMTQNPWFYFANTAIMAVAGYYAGKLFFIFIESKFLERKV